MPEIHDRRLRRRELRLRDIDGAVLFGVDLEPGTTPRAPRRGTGHVHEKASIAGPRDR